MSDPNPYAAPVAATQKSGIKSSLTPKDLAKAQAIIKDAGQFWLACILCILCSGIGATIVPIWYGVRLLQWNSISKKYPALRQPGPVLGSFEASFQNAQWKLIVGTVLGCVIFVLIFVLLFGGLLLG